MTHRTLAAATAALLALAVPAGASAPPATTGTWVPTAVTPDVSLLHDAAAFADGTGLVAGAPYPGVARERGLWTTSDFGRTWSLDPFALPYDASYAFGSPTEWWGHSHSATLRHTTDAGATWAAVPLPLAATERQRGLLSHDADGGGYAVAARIGTGTCATHDTLFFTGDGGATWQRHDLPAYAAGGPLVHSVDVADADTAVMTAYNTVSACGGSESPLDVYVTGDAGATWTRVVASPGSGPQVFDAAISPDGTTLAVAYNDGTVKWSGDGGATFAPTVLRQPGAEPLPDNLTGWLDAAIDVELVDETAYVTLSGGSIWRTTDGTAWTLDGLHGSNVATRVAAFDADRAISVSQGVVATRLG